MDWGNRVLDRQDGILQLVLDLDVLVLEEMLFYPQQVHKSV